MTGSHRLFYRDFLAHDHAVVDVGSDTVGLDIWMSFHSGDCPNCSSPLSTHVHRPGVLERNPKLPDTAIEMVSYLFVCEPCGWWQIKRDAWDRAGFVANGALWYHGIIERLDLSSDDIPLADVRSQLLKRWEDRRILSPSKAEELVAGILREHLRCDVLRTTANVNAPDGGIDLYVCSVDGKIERAVQVKRRITREVEPVSAVREFIGALLVEGVDKGVFVTTADRYSEPARAVPGRLRSSWCRLELELVDGTRLFELLKATNKNVDLVLPEGISECLLWEGPKGQHTTTRELLGLCPS